MTDQVDYSGDVRLATVLFADVKGFTAMSEHLPPDQVAGIMNRCFEALSRPIVKYGGTIDKYVGDAVMARFGAPTAHEDDPVRAVAAGLEMQAALRHVSDAIRAEAGTDLEMRIGINTGQVMAGEVGSSALRQFTLMGNTVNLASRLEHEAEPGTVLVGENTYRLARHAFDFQELPPMEIRGQSRAVRSYVALRRRDDVDRRTSVTGYRWPLVGRDSELATLDECLAAALTGLGSVVEVIGGTGVGKSRLIDAFWKRSETSDLRRIAVSAPSFGESIPFSVLAAFVRALLFDEPTQPGIGPAAIDRALTALLPDAEIEDAVTVLADMLGVATGEDATATRLEARSRLAILARSLGRILVALSERTPLLLVLDDMQWADAASLKIFDDLLGAVAGHRIMAVVIHRPEIDHVWTNLPSHRQIRLAEFEDEEAQAMVGQFLRAFGLEEMIGEKIVEKAGGNPFFLEQILNGLITSGAIVERAGSWQLVRELSSITVPDTIQGVLLARLDRISQGARSILEVAAVIGRVFAYHLLQTIVEAEQQLDVHLEQLRTQDFIFEKSVAPELEFMFRHSLTQDVVYGSLVAGKRRTFHLRVAQTIESLGGADSGEHVPLLAYHYARTDEWEKAVEYSIAAAERARRLYANDDAMQHFEQALDFLERSAAADDSRTAQVLEALGDIHAVTGAHAKAADYYARVSESQADPSIRGRVERKRGDLAQTRGSYAEARQAYRAAREALEEGGDTGELIAMWVGIARMNRSRGAVEDAAAACRQALAIKDDAGELVRGALYCELGEIERERGQYKTAAGFFDAAAAAFDRESAVERRAVAAEGLAEVSLLSGKLQDALVQYDVCCDIYERVADRQRLASARLGAARTRHRTGQLEDAIDLLAQALAAGTELDDQLLMASCTLELASIHLERGDRDAAQALADKSYAAFKRIRHWRGLAETQLLRARLSLSGGDVEQATSALDRARNLATEMGNTRLLTQVAMIRAAIREASGEWGEAAAQERLAAGLAREIGDQVMVSEIRRALGRILLRRGERGAGVEALVESITTLRRLGARLEAARAVLDYVSAAGISGNDVDVADMLQFALEALTTANVPDELQTARELAASMSPLPM